VVNNYNTYFVPANAYLVIVGDVSFKEVKKKVEKLFGGDNWKAAVPPALSYNTPKDLQYSQINFVDMPNAVQSEISLVNLSTLKMTDKDYFAALMANQILGGGGEGRLFLNLREKQIRSKEFRNSLVTPTKSTSLPIWTAKERRSLSI
jgi:predicted Zn-dependent peptidase